MTNENADSGLAMTFKINICTGFISIQAIQLAHLHLIGTRPKLFSFKAFNIILSIRVTNGKLPSSDNVGLTCKLVRSCCVDVPTRLTNISFMIKPELDVVAGNSLHDGCFFKKSLNPSSPITKGINEIFIFNVIFWYF